MIEGFPSFDRLCDETCIYIYTSYSDSVNFFELIRNLTQDNTANLKMNLINAFNQIQINGLLELFIKLNNKITLLDSTLSL